MAPPRVARVVESGHRGGRVAVGEADPGGLEDRAKPDLEVRDRAGCAVDVVARLGAGRFLGGEDGVLGEQLLAPARLQDDGVDAVEDLLRTRDDGFGRRARLRAECSATPASAASARQRSSREASATCIASASRTTPRRAQLGVVESLVQRAQHRQPILQPRQLRRIDSRIQRERRCRSARTRRRGRSLPGAPGAAGGSEPSEQPSDAAPPARGAREQARPPPPRRTAANEDGRDAESATAASGCLELGEQFVDHARGQAAQPGGRDLATQRCLAGVVAAGATRGARNRDQLAAQALRALADIAAELPRGPIAATPAAISLAPGADRPQPFDRRLPARRGTVGVRPRLGQLAAERGDLGLDVERETRIGRGRLDLRRLELGLAHHLREAHPPAGDVGEARREPRAFGLHPAHRSRWPGSRRERQDAPGRRRRPPAGCGRRRGCGPGFEAGRLRPRADWRCAAPSRPDPWPRGCAPGPARRSRPGGCPRAARSPPAAGRRAAGRSPARRCGGRRR